MQLSVLAEKNIYEGIVYHGGLLLFGTVFVFEVVIILGLVINFGIVLILRDVFNFGVAFICVVVFIPLKSSCFFELKASTQKKDRI